MDYYNFNSTEEEIFAENTFSAASAASFDDNDIQNNFNKNISTDTTTNISSLNLKNSSPPITGIDCGRLTRSELLTWIDVQYYTEGVLFSIVGAIGLIGNMIAIAILLTKDMRKHSFNQMLLGLAFFDLVFVLCGVPVHITPIFGLENWLYAWLYAYFLYPFTAVSLTGSIYMTMAVTIERYIAVSHPHYYRDINARMNPMKRVLCYAVPVTTFSILVNIPKFLETEVEYNDENEIKYDVTDLRLNPTYIWWYTLSYICHPLLTTTVGPFFVLTFFNYKIYKGIKRARTNVRSSNRHGEMNLAMVLVTICIVFLLCNSLRLFLGLQAIINVNITIQCAAVNQPWIPPNWMLIMESISHLLLLFSSSSNFLIYCTISTRFKIFFKRKFFFRNRPNVDIPEVNSRIALQTIGNSNNKNSDCGNGSYHNTIPLEPMPMAEPKLPKINIQQYSIHHHHIDNKATITLIQRSYSDGHIEKKCISSISVVTTCTNTETNSSHTTGKSSTKSQRSDDISVISEPRRNHIDIEDEHSSIVEENSTAV